MFLLAQGKVSVTLKYGRQDCGDGPFAWSRNVFPDAHHGVPETIKFFNDQFGLDAEESVAILGRAWYFSLWSLIIRTEL